LSLLAGTICFYILSGDLYGQTYPLWFLKQGDVLCPDRAVGYVNISYFPDSSVNGAIRNACEALRRQKENSIKGNQSFWETEIGTYSMYSDIFEMYDSTVFRKDEVTLLDTVFLDNMVAVIISLNKCTIDPIIKERRNIIDVSPPSWVDTPPTSEDFLFAVGLAPRYFYESSSWLEAERLARLNIARQVHLRVKGMQKISGEGQELRDEHLSVVLKDQEIVERWYDIKNRIFYVLAKCPKR
jgi:hypothetical protein